MELESRSRVWEDACPWRALLSGQWWLASPPRGRERRRLAIVRASPRRTRALALTPREHRVIGRAAAGMSNKVGAAEVGESPSTFSRVLRGAMDKLGVSSRASLIEVSVRLRAAANPSEEDVEFQPIVVLGMEAWIVSAPLPSLPECFTPAERQVLALVLEGHSNAEIATTRSTSQRTVANQLAALYRKRGVTTREELVAELFEVQRKPSCRAQPRGVPPMAASRMASTSTAMRFTAAASMRSGQ